MQKTRRALLRKGLFGLAALPLGMGVLSTQTYASTLPRLSPDAPQAKALAYVEVAADAADHPKFRADAFCDNCLFWRAQNEGCTLFPQNSVEPKGWCQSWVAQPN